MKILVVFELGLKFTAIIQRCHTCAYWVKKDSHSQEYRGSKLFVLPKRNAKTHNILIAQRVLKTDREQARGRLRRQGPRGHRRRWTPQ